VLLESPYLELVLHYQISHSCHEIIHVLDVVKAEKCLGQWLVSSVKVVEVGTSMGLTDSTGTSLINRAQVTGKRGCKGKNV